MPQAVDFIFERIPLLETISCKLIVLICCVSCLAENPAQRQTPRLKGYLNSPYGYWEYLPENYYSIDKHPVVIYLHGIKEIGNGTSETELQKVLWAGPGRLVAKDNRNFPFILISPQSPGLEEGFNAGTVDQLIDIVIKNYKADADRIYVTGLSYGGYATWNIATHSSEKLAAVVPICSCGSSSLDPYKLKDLPVWAFVNSGDYDIPGCMYNVTESIRSAGGNPLITMYPKKGHNAWVQTYQDQKMWDWLLSQRRLTPDENNQAPAIVNPGNVTLTIGYPATIPILASDRNNDSITFVIEEPLPAGVTFTVTKSGQGMIRVYSTTLQSYPINITAIDNHGGTTSLQFVIQTEHSPVFALSALIFIIHTIVLLLSFIRQPIDLVNAATFRAAGLLVRGVTLLAKGNSRI